MRNFINTTASGQKVEVIGAAIYLDGQPEAKHLAEVTEHPNSAAILRACRTPPTIPRPSWNACAWPCSTRRAWRASDSTCGA